MAYGIANDGAAAPDGLPKNLIARLVFVKTAQGYLPNIPLALQKLTFGCAELRKTGRSTFPRPRSNVVTIFLRS
jgi:hypothetical protein